ncbi:MAG TPA: beta-galactosidase trimerization domain-containing protein [Planctomycetota bacterium]|nr:beta-galactosidase trimerization domain-containing protein [Planctomycetota bacterium]
MRHAAEKFFTPCLLLLIYTGLSLAGEAAPPAPEPTRIVIECEDMKGVAQDKFGPGSGWQVGRWGEDLYQNMIFGGVWASRLRMAMTDERDGNAEAHSIIEVPADGTYKVWVKYECPPNFNYAFGIRIAPEDSSDKPLFKKTYGLIDAPKHYCFTNDLKTGSLYWNWGIDHDAAEGYEVALPKGRYRVTLEKAPNPAPAGARSVDAILITSDLSKLSAPHFPRYPLLDELRRANHVYFRFRNQSDTPIRISWNHWGHRYNDFYSAQYRDKVSFYDASGKQLPAPAKNTGDWPEAIAPGQASVWYDLGPTMNTESTSPFLVNAVPEGTPKKKKGEKGEKTASVPFAVDIALQPNEKAIVKSFELGKGEATLSFLVQPDLHRKEGVEFTRKIPDIYREVARELNSKPRLGPLPKKIMLFASTGHDGAGAGIETEEEFRYALGLNTLGGTHDKQKIDEVLKWWEPKGGLIPRSVHYHHSQKPAEVIEKVKKAGIEDHFYCLSYGDEIGLPAVDVNDPAKIAGFRDYIKAHKETPESLGLANWEQVKPLNALSADVAVQIGVIPKETPKTEQSALQLKRLYWYSLRFRSDQGIKAFAEKTKELKAGLGNSVESTANLGGMHPFYWMHQAAFIESFKHKAMSLAWSEDYTYCQPEASRLVVDFEAAYLRKGASYHDTRMMFYCMPHYPGNTPEHLIQNAVMLWGQNVKDLDWFNISPDAFSTENYVTYRGGLPIWRTIRNVSGMAGLIEDDLLAARPAAAPVAMLLSEASDVWELEGKSQNDINPGSVATNVSQEERKNIWYALRLAGYRVDMLTEEDVADGLLKKYKALYICGQNLERKAAAGIKEWVQSGGVVMATAGAARKNEFDESLTVLDDIFARGPQKSYDRYKGALRAKIELLFEKPKDQLVIGSSVLDVLCSREVFEPQASAEVLGRYKSDNSAAWIKTSPGKGKAYYTGTLPGQAFVRQAMPVLPVGKGGGEKTFSHFEPVNYNETAREMILRPLAENKILPDISIAHRSVVASRLDCAASTLLPISHLAEQHDGKLKNLEIRLSGVEKKVSKVWSCFHAKGFSFKQNGSEVIFKLPSLQSADVIVLTY